MRQQFNILVVDDNEDLARNLQDILIEFGYSASVAFTGAEALALSETTPFHLALLDYKLPDMDGLQLRDRLAEMTDASYILITGVAPEAWAEEAVRNDSIIALETKPLNMDRLLERIEGVAARRRGASGPGDGGAS
jgi:DNA-binding response OmpR family regulator